MKVLNCTPEERVTQHENREVYFDYIQLYWQKKNKANV